MMVAEHLCDQWPPSIVHLPSLVIRGVMSSQVTGPDRFHLSFDDEVFLPVVGPSLNMKDSDLHPGSSKPFK